MKKAYALINLLVILALIIWNYYSNVAGINGNTVGSLSDEYDNLFTPAGYAFSIWGLIFIALLGCGIFQVIRAWSGKENDFILQIGPWLTIANLANIAWVWFWLNEQTLLTIFLMASILIGLTMVTIRLGMAITEAPSQVKAWVWGPISIYYGWITVAMIANVSAYLAKIGWHQGLSEIYWTVVLILAAIAINLFILWNRHLRAFVLVGAWALLAISVRHWDSIWELQWLGLAGALTLLAAVIWYTFFRPDHKLEMKVGPFRI